MLLDAGRDPLSRRGRGGFFSMLPLLNYCQQFRVFKESNTQRPQLLHQIMDRELVKVTVKVRVEQFVKLHLTATGNHLPYGITQCYLPPGRGDFPAFTPAEAGTRFSDPEEMQG